MIIASSIYAISIEGRMFLDSPFFKISLMVITDETVHLIN